MLMLLTGRLAKCVLELQEFSGKLRRTGRRRRCKLRVDRQRQETRTPCEQAEMGDTETGENRGKYEIYTVWVWPLSHDHISKKIHIYTFYAKVIISLINGHNCIHLSLKNERAQIEERFWAYLEADGWSCSIGVCVGVKILITQSDYSSQLQKKNCST